MRTETSKSPSRWLAASAATATAALAAAAYNRGRTRRAERRTPPIGHFVDGDGVRLHYLRRGHGPSVVLIHGNGVLLQDWLASGLFDRLVESHDVIAFDRPGFGYSSRPRSTLWTARAQASALAKALERLGTREACVVGHSFGALIALALGLDHPGLVARLVLLGGYYFPEERMDLVLNSAPAVPIAGDILRHTVSPIAGRALMPAMERQLFAPAPISPRWHADFPIDMVVRPAQLRATAADFALANPAAASLSKRYEQLQAPASILAGTGDRIVDLEAHSRRLHRVLPESRFVSIADAGHMIHYTATDAVMAEIASGEQRLGRNETLTVSGRSPPRNNLTGGEFDRLLDEGGPDGQSHF